MDKQLFDASLLNKIGKRLLAKGQTIAVAESVTSGLIQFALSSMENAEKFYHGGVTAYNIAQKFKHLNVEPIHALECNCVSQKIADEMAINVSADFNSDWGIGITGYATPVPESEHKVFAFYAISFQQTIMTAGKMDSIKTVPPGPQISYVNAVLEVLKELLA
ncbi:MAG: CinA family protein [Chitinophagaceae bacterium]